MMKSLGPEFPCSPVHPRCLLLGLRVKALQTLQRHAHPGRFRRGAAGFWNLVSGGLSDENHSNKSGQEPAGLSGCLDSHNTHLIPQAQRAVLLVLAGLGAQSSRSLAPCP